MEVDETQTHSSVKSAATDSVMIASHLTLCYVTIAYRSTIFCRQQLRFTGEHAQDLGVTPQWLLFYQTFWLCCDRSLRARLCSDILLQKIPFRLLFCAGLVNFSFGPISVVSYTILLNFHSSHSVGFRRKLFTHTSVSVCNI